MTGKELMEIVDKLVKTATKLEVRLSKLETKLSKSGDNPQSKETAEDDDELEAFLRG